MGTKRNANRARTVVKSILSRLVDMRVFVTERASKVVSEYKCVRVCSSLRI